MILTLIIDVIDMSQATNGVFINKAKITISETDPIEKSATTTWGQPTIYKYDGSNEGFLSGAKSKPCTSEACPDQDVVLTELIAESGGKILLPVVRPGIYYLVETETPVDYVKTEAQQVTAEAGVTETPAQPIFAGKNYKPVTDTKQAVP